MLLSWRKCFTVLKRTEAMWPSVYIENTKKVIMKGFLKGFLKCLVSTAFHHLTTTVISFLSEEAKKAHIHLKYVIKRWPCLHTNATFLLGDCYVSFLVFALWYSKNLTTNIFLSPNIINWNQKLMFKKANNWNWECIFVKLLGWDGQRLTSRGDPECFGWCSEFDG